MKQYLRTTKNLLLLVITIWVLNSCTEPELAGVNFNSVEKVGYEGDGAQSFEITLSKSLASEITLDIEFSGTAASSDYSYSATAITIPAGDTKAEIKFELIDNDNYDPDVEKTIIIELVSISGPGVEDATFGENRTYTYTIKEDDMEIELTWVDANFDMRLMLKQGESIIRESPANFSTTKELMLLGSDSDGKYQTESLMWRGSLDENSSIPYSITLKFPDGSTETNSDNLILDRFFNVRHLFEITKSGSTYTSVKDPFGTDG